MKIKKFSITNHLHIASLFFSFFTALNLSGQNWDNNNIAISIRSNQLVVNAPIPINYTLKSGKLDLKSNTVLISKYGLKVKVNKNINITKGSGIINAVINGTAPSIPGIYKFAFQKDKLHATIIIKVIAEPSETNFDNDEYSQITTNNNSFNHRSNIKIKLNPGELALTLEPGQLLGKTDGIKITYAGNLRTYIPGEYNIPINITGEAGLMSGTYKITLDHTPGLNIIHNVIINNSKPASCFKCQGIRINIMSGKSFSIRKPIILTLSGSMIDLTANQLLGESDGIEVRYSGLSRSLYPGDNNINIVINGGTTLKPGDYSIIMDKLSNIISACDISVRISDGENNSNF